MASYVLPDEGTFTSGGVVQANNGLLVSNGGVTVGTAVATTGTTASFASETVLSGGLAINPVISGGGYVLVSAGGVTSGGNVVGDVTVYSGGVANDMLGDFGGLFTVISGGITNGTDLEGSREVVGSGSTANYSFVSAGSTEDASGGTANDTTLLGDLRVGDDGVANETIDTIDTGGYVAVSSGGITTSTDITSGGVEIVEATGTANNSVVTSNGGLIINGGTTNGVKIGDEGTVTAIEGSAGPGGIAFTGSYGILDLDGTAAGLAGSGASAPVSPIIGFGATDQIDLGSVPYTSAGSLALTGDELTIHEGANTVTLSLVSGTTSGFTLSPDFYGNTILTIGPPVAYPGPLPPSNPGGPIDPPLEPSPSSTYTQTVVTPPDTGVQTVFGGAGDHAVLGGVLPLYFIGGLGTATVTGGSGNTTMFGASGEVNSFLQGGSGSNMLTAGAGASTLVGGSGNTTEFASGDGPVELVAGAQGTTIMAGQFGEGPESFFTAPAATAIMALNGATDTVVGGTGNSTVLGGAGHDVFGFLDGHAGGHEAIEGLTANDVLVFGGYTSYPIASEQVLEGSDLITLTDGTQITLVGFDHKVF